MEMSKKEFKNAFREVASSEFSHIPQNESSIEFVFSERFNKRMEKLIKAQKKVYYNLVNTVYKRIAVLCVVVLTILTTACSVKEIREPIVNFFTEVYETFIKYFFEGNTTDTIIQEYSLKVLPDGFVQTNLIRSDTLITTTYVNASNERIKFTQQTTDNASHTFDNENGEITTIMFSKMKVDIYETEGITHALWVYDGYYFKLSYYGKVDLNTIKSIIETVE